MTYAEKMAELQRALRELRTALAYVVAPWLRLATHVGIPALQDDKATAVRALLSIELGAPNPQALAGEALDELEVERPR